MDLLLDLEEKPYARNSADGHEALSAVGQLAFAASKAAVALAGGADLAAEAHRMGCDSLPSWKASLLRQHLDEATALLKHTPGICRSAVVSITRATAHPEPVVPAAPPVPSPLPPGRPRVR